MTENNQNINENKYRLNQIYFYLTEGCNLACRHCWIAPKYQTAEHSYPSLDLDVFRYILRQAKAMHVSVVKLTGGEPLLHPQIYDLLNIIRTEGFSLTIETNGILVTQDMAEMLATFKGLFISVSLDGVDAETYEWVRGVKGSFENALNGIRNLVKYGIHPQIIMTIMKCNKDQMEPMVKLAEALDAESVKFNLLQPTARGEKMHEQGEALDIEELVRLGRWVDNELSETTKIRVVYDHPVAFRPLNKIFDGKGSGVCGIHGILGVLADGSYALCGIGENVPELIFGHAKKDRLEDVWNGNPILQEIREGIPMKLEGICGDCLMKARCFGSCVAQNYYRYKRLWAPFWFCEQADEKWLFPKSRTKRLS
ncbi:MAG: SynChlorMet cassette radical SAM/SPASM protein ScmF [Candidatus Poribacteria bacterium]